ncbi:MAG TPA: hypothetical protein DEP72_00360 [Clostridiales bacterium]|nr:MAG: hypothetical protein A2Y18_00945 [Clostridiales bacterium GWD2_32_19]HCC06603.1 hypothetical protein [Clostridiales bacterium]
MKELEKCKNMGYDQKMLKTDMNGGKAMFDKRYDIVKSSLVMANLHVFREGGIEGEYKYYETDKDIPFVEGVIESIDYNGLVEVGPSREITNLTNEFTSILIREESLDEIIPTDYCKICVKALRRHDEAKVEVFDDIRNALLENVEYYKTLESQSSEEIHVSKFVDHGME